MATVVAGMLVIAALVVNSVLLLGTTVFNEEQLALAEREADSAIYLRTHSGVTIDTAGSTSGGPPTTITLTIRNSGAVSVADFGDMDVIAMYLSSGGALTTERLAYSAGAPADNQWGVTSISPDSFNPGIWDPDETATLDLRVSPAVEPGAPVTVTIVAPSGSTDSVVFYQPS